MTPHHDARVFVVGLYIASHAGPFTEILSLADVFQVRRCLNYEVGESNGVLGYLQLVNIVSKPHGLLLPHRNMMDYLLNLSDGVK